MAPRRGPATRAGVFYNPAMALDRDIGVAFTRRARALGLAWKSGWEMLAATGVRALRMQQEGAAPEALYLSEMHAQAIEVLRANRALTGHPENRVLYHDARWPPPLGPIDYVDLDPYGTPVPFLDAAFAVCQAGTILAVTATDMPVLAGVAKGVCEDRYGARPVPGFRAGEGGLRILLGYLARCAAAHRLALTPRLAYVGSHHVRAYVSLTRFTEPPPVGPIDATRWEGAPLPAPGVYGPMWLGPIMDPDWMRGMIAFPSAAQPGPLTRFLAMATGESTVDAPFFDEPNRIAERVGLATPPALEPLLTALRDSGHRAARSHVRPSAFRTDAPRAVVEDLSRKLAARNQSQNARVRA